VETLLQVYNTLTRKIETFKPREDKKVKMFTCGPSVYRRPHIGNYRTFLYEDIFQRYLEYWGYEVVRLISLTDIEDKAIIEAEKEGISVKELAEKNRKMFFTESELLKMKSPTYSACMMACSSTAVEEAARLIKILLQKGYAYYHKHKGRRNVYFEPLKFDGFGKLSRLDMTKWPEKKRRFHQDTYPGTPWNMGDFILWHGYKEGDADYWDTEIGTGRPSWNIQDAATITKYLGMTIDVACGGIDNLVRHHDYTLAIVESVSEKKLAKYWLHGQHLLVDGKKMSKSKGNVYYPDDLIKRGHKGEHIRFFLIYGHYRKRLNFTFEKMENRSQKLDKLKNMVSNLGKAKSLKSSKKAKKLVDEIDREFEVNMNNDLDVKAAFDSLFKTVSKLTALKTRGKLTSKDASRALASLQKIDYVLQIIFDSHDGART
jgi:cysteinyl-tRNA synthetase